MRHRDNKSAREIAKATSLSRKRVRKFLRRGSDPLPAYSQAWPFTGRIDRWQEIEFHVSHIRIWTSGVDAGTASVEDPRRVDFHMRGFHGVTPETHETCHYFWTIATNPQPGRADVTQLVSTRQRRSHGGQGGDRAQWQARNALTFDAGI